MVTNADVSLLLLARPAKQFYRLKAFADQVEVMPCRDVFTRDLHRVGLQNKRAMTQRIKLWSNDLLYVNAVNDALNFFDKKWLVFFAHVVVKTPRVA